MAALGKLGNYKNFGLVLVRMGLGLMFVWHGYPKLVGGEKTWIKLGGAMGDFGIHAAPMLWGLLCALIETIGGTLVVIGFWFRPICVLLLLNMIVAATVSYYSGGLDDAAHAIEDGVMFVGLIFLGPGKYSVDKK
jgi:putative oxidoreductase